MASNFGIKVSHPNFDVSAATGDQVLFTSAERSIKIFKSGKGTTAGVGLDVPHGFSTVPGYMVFDTDTFQAGAYGTNIRSYSTATNLRLNFTGACTYKYYIFGEEATDGYSSIPTEKTYGLVVAKDGYDVGTSMQNLIVQSNYQSPLVLDNKTISLTSSAGGIITSELAHNLGFAPAFMFNVSCSFFNADYSQVGPVETGDWGLWADVCVDANKIYLQGGFLDYGSFTPDLTITARVVLLNLDLAE